MMDVVIPTREDSDTLGPIVRLFRTHPRIGNIIIVMNGQPYADYINDQGAFEDTLMIYREEGNKGKAVRLGLNFVETQRVILCDADLKGLKFQHISLLTRPFNGMIVGVPDRPERMPVPWPVPDDVWQVVSGERSLPTAIARKIDLHGYAMEVQINREARREGIQTRFVKLNGVAGKIRQNARRMAELRRDREWLESNWDKS